MEEYRLHPDELRVRRSRLLRRARAFENYNEALDRYRQLIDRRSGELAHFSGPSETAQSLEDARIIWTAARRAWVRERLS